MKKVFVMTLDNGKISFESFPIVREKFSKKTIKKDQFKIFFEAIKISKSEKTNSIKKNFKGNKKPEAACLKKNLEYC
jgi:hypothetical protein